MLEAPPVEPVTGKREADEYHGKAGEPESSVLTERWTLRQHPVVDGNGRQDGTLLSRFRRGACVVVRMAATRFSVSDGACEKVVLDLKAP